MKKVLFIPILLLVLISCSQDEETEAPTNTVQAPLFDKDVWWGQIVDFPPEIFFASDLSNTLREKFMIDLNLAISQFGNYGPLECYVLGNSTNAANELAIQYCNRRVERGQEGDLNGCIDYQMNDNSYGMGIVKWV